MRNFITAFEFLAEVVHIRRSVHKALAPIPGILYSGVWLMSWPTKASVRLAEHKGSKQGMGVGVAKVAGPHSEQPFIPPRVPRKV